MIEKALQYKDVCLVPKYSEISSRGDIDISVEVCSKKFKSPVIPANMRAVIDETIAENLDRNGYFYIMHRFNIDIFDFVFKANTSLWNNISISIGVKQEDHDLIRRLSTGLPEGHRVDYITVDIAHGHSKAMMDILTHIKRYLPDTCVIAGNVATPEAVKDLADWGANIVKVGIGQGNVCTTKDKTGFTTPMFTCVKNCANEYYNADTSTGLTQVSTPYEKIPIIADGGIRCNGDIAKAISAGASMVMVGSLFSQCTDSPAATVTVNGRTYKQYFGSASEHNKNHKNHIEGVMKEVPTNNMTYTEKLREIKQDIQSAISYSGGNGYESLRGVDCYQVVP